MFRNAWVPYGEAVTCMACGEGVKSGKTDQITVYNIETRQESYVQVASSAEDCCEWQCCVCVCVFGGIALFVRNCVRSHKVDRTWLWPSPCGTCMHVNASL